MEKKFPNRQMLHAEQPTGNESETNGERNLVYKPAQLSVQIISKHWLSCKQTSIHF